jgi:hypothetical protein
MACAGWTAGPQGSGNGRAGKSHEQNNKTMGNGEWGKACRSKEYQGRRLKMDDACIEGLGGALVWEQATWVIAYCARVHREVSEGRSC